ncbi:2-phosphosulfolactate phosphatase [Candidatus Riflebacteria bacterium]
MPAVDIRILPLLKGAAAAEGLTVIIDVFRAFSVACFIFNNGAERLYPVSSLEQAFALRKRNSEFILIGERGGKKPEGFDFGNSAAEVETVDFRQKRVIQATGSGTKGIIAASNAAQIITGSFVNLKAVVQYILDAREKRITLVPMGISGLQESDEDNFCAGMLKNLLLGKRENFVRI